MVYSKSAAEYLELSAVMGQQIVRSKRENWKKGVKFPLRIDL